jgi:agmatinase
MNLFDPNAIGIPNGNFLGLPYSPEEASIILIPVPWDVTTSYRPGTAEGPAAVIDASTQIDLFDLFLEDAWKHPVATLEIPEHLKTINALARPMAEKIIAMLAEGVPETDTGLLPLLNQVNEASATMNNWVKETSLFWMKQGKTPCVLGGDHSTPLGLIQAFASKFPGMGILHIDAHADLRNAYEGFEFSHASIMFNAMKNKAINKLVQVGIRDVCENELAFAAADKRITIYHDYRLAFDKLSGKPFSESCQEIIGHLPDMVYVSFDIDGLDPALCPHTGTPVPGGINFNEAILLLQMLATSGRKIIGFDLCEVAPGPDDEWDAIVGARVLQKLCNLTHLSHKFSQG